MSVVSLPSRADPVVGPMAGRPVDGRRARLGLHLFEDLAALEAEWRSFEQIADCTAFQAYDWAAVWQMRVGARRGTRPAIVTVRSPEGSILLLAPLAVERVHATRRLTFLGHDLCDYNAPLLAPEFGQAVGPGEFPDLWRQITALVTSRPALRYDAVSLTKMPERIGAQRNPFLDLKVELDPNAAYVTRLGPDWDAFYRDKRSSATRRRDRTKRNRLQEHGPVRFAGAESGEEARRMLHALMQQKRRSLSRVGAADLFARPGYRDFYLELASNPQLQAFVHTSRIDVGERWAAINLGLTFRGCYYHVLASYTDGPLARFGPGALHLRELMRYSIGLGLKRFDFTIGDEPYKREWADEILLLFDHAAAVTWRGWPYTVVSRCLRGPLRLIKQNPRLYRILVGIRASLRGRRLRKPQS